jgi:IS5 family transposase
MARVNRRILGLVDEVASHQLGLVTSAQLVEVGLAESSLRYRIRQGGPWARVLPGIYLVGTGVLSEQQRDLAALLYVRAPCLLTGGAALRSYGIVAAREVNPGEVHVLIPHLRKRASTHFVHVQRSITWPEVAPAEHRTPVARAAIDACRAVGSRQLVRAVLSEVVRDGHADVATLERELGTAQRRRSALARDVLGELRAGPVSVPELELAHRWRSSGLPRAVFNADLYDRAGEFVARPDVYIEELGIAVEVESRTHHFSVEDWDRTMRRHARMTAKGLVVLHVAPRRIREDWAGIAADVNEAARVQAGRTVPRLRVVTRDP